MGFPENTVINYWNYLLFRVSSYSTVKAVTLQQLFQKGAIFQPLKTRSVRMFTLLCLSDDLSTIQKAVQQFTESLQSLVTKEGANKLTKRKVSPSRPTRINVEQTRFYRTLHKRVIENNTELIDSKPKSMQTVFKLWNSDNEDSICDQACDSEVDMSYSDKHGVTCDSSCTLGELETDWSMTSLDSSIMLSDNDSEVSEGRRYRESDTHNSYIWDVHQEQYILESEVHLTESGSSSCDTDFKIDLVEPNDFMQGLVRKESYAVPYQ